MLLCTAHGASVVENMISFGIIYSISCRRYEAQVNTWPGGWGRGLAHEMGWDVHRLA